MEILRIIPHEAFIIASNSYLIYFLQTSHPSPNKLWAVFLYIEKSCKQSRHKQVIQNLYMPWHHMFIKKKSNFTMRIV